MPPGVYGFCAGLLILVLTLLISRLSLGAGPFAFDPRNVPKAFEPILARYLRAAEFIIGLASASIVLLVGSSALHNSQGHLPWRYASPLNLLGFSVVYGVAFIVWLNYRYEEFQHGQDYTRNAYSLTLALGFGSLFCFFTGYFWLIYTAPKV